MAPLIQDAKNYPKDFEVIICVTGQHKEMLDQVIDFFKILFVTLTL
jgi:UDP-N-acetylglucosamine 2-epimerase (non-hydrolysing)